MMNDQDNLDISDHEEEDSSEKLEDISVMNDQDSLDISDHKEKDSMPSEDISEEDKSLTIAEVYNYLVSKQYKGDATINYRRCLRRKANKFTIIEGRLFYIGNKGNDEPRLVVSDPVERAKIVRAIHEQGHLGISRTSKAITSKYYWEKSMHTDITSVVKTCHSCQKSKPKLKKTPGRLHPIPITPKVWNQLGIDLIGPLTRTPRGNRYILTIVDYFSKWAEVAPLKTKEADGVVSVLFEVFCRFGFPKVIISDQGREFCNKLSDELFKLTNTQHRITSPYHPQSNGLTEHFNQTLSNSLRPKVNAEQNDWDIHLNLILFSYRATMQSSTQYSPFHMMFGREPTFPIDTEHQLPLDEADQCEKLTNEEISVAMDSLHSFQKEMYSTAKENITKAQKKQKDYYDSRHQTQTFAVGEKVLVENTAQKQRKGGKLKDKWLGPYRINREICKGVYALESMDGKLMKQSCNVSRLKLYSEDVCLKNESSCRPKELTVHEDVTASDHTSINPSEDKPQHSSDELSQSHVSKDSVAKHKLSDNRKRRRCGECQQCSAEDCGVCRFCIDKKKIGGPDKLKQCCIKRRCKIIKVGGKDDPVLFKLDGHELTYSDLNCIWIGEWLNDKVVNYAAKVLSKETLLMEIVPSYVFVKLMSNKFDNIDKYFKEGLGSNFGTLFPCCLNSHWCLCAIYPFQKSVCVYDSFGGYYDAVCHESRKLSHLLPDLLTYNKNVPLQNNGDDCGVFTCKFMECIIHDEDLNFETSSHTMRQWLLQTIFDSFPKRELAHNDTLHELKKFGFTVKINGRIRGAGSLSINDFQKAVSENKQLLIDIIKGKRVTPFSDGYMTLSNKERARMKSASFGIAHHYLTDDDLDVAFTILSSLVEDEQQRECENVFGLVVDILFPEVFIQMLIKQRGISYDDGISVYLQN